MPIYEYKCPKCGTFETMQRITEPALKRCPTCKSKVERMISNTSFVLKGSGWYATDYARSGSSGKSTDTSSDKSGSKPSSESTGNGANGSSSDTASSTSSDKSGASSSSEKSAKTKASD
jgi:putative FmdB family regulatory protein